jgi:transcriptional regulator with XRE-family HTH domain
LTVDVPSAIVVATAKPNLAYQVLFRMSLGEYIKTIRRRRGLSQWELSRLSGLTRSHLSRLELDSFESPSAETFLCLAKALKIHPNDLYQAAGYIEENARFRRESLRNSDEAFTELEKLALFPVPVMENSNSEMRMSAGSDPFGLSSNAEPHIVGLYARGFSLEPDVMEGDIILVDRGKMPVQDNIILGFLEHRVQLLRYHINLARCEVAQESTHIFGVVVGINRKFN